MNPWRTEDRADGAREFHRRASAELRQLKLSARDADPSEFPAVAIIDGESMCAACLAAEKAVAA